MDFQRHNFSQVTSTSILAREWIQKGSPEGTVLVADVQTAGYGRRGNVWQSLPGNLMATVILTPEKPLTEVSQLAFVAALAIGHAIKPFLRPDVVMAYKWPNDIMLNGEKVCGCLVETEQLLDAPLYVLLGIGLNIRQAPMTDQPATALANACQDCPDRDQVLDEILASFSMHYQRWLFEGFDWVKTQWQAHAYRLHDTVDFLAPDGLVSGRFQGIDSKGGLMLKIDNQDDKIFYSGQISKN